jgi:hypothetical protein
MPPVLSCDANPAISVAFGRLVAAHVVVSKGAHSTASGVRGAGTNVSDWKAGKACDHGTNAA